MLRHRQFIISNAGSAGGSLAIMLGAIIFLMGLTILLMPQLLIALISGFLMFVGASLVVSGFSNKSSRNQGVVIDKDWR